MKNIYNTILVPFDFSERAQAALEESFNLAKMTGLEITLFHVIRDNQGIFSAFGSERSRSMKKEYEDQMRDQLQDYAAEASRKSGNKVGAVISHGKAHDKILKGAHLLHSKFIVQGINSDPVGSKSTYIGDNALRVIKKAECPVITVKNPRRFDGCRSILLPLDLSQETRQKVGHAIEMARMFGSTIKVVSVYWSTTDKDILNRLRMQMKQVKDFISKSNVEVTTHIINKSGTAKILAPLILDYAKAEKDIDLVMIMTQTEAGLFDLFLGSSAQYFITHSEVPVMSIIPKELGFASMIN
ncbi:MAG: universal stress protein [Bacteroidales bacterium]|nr:universal stress protein [Bacteroidales bacterium]